MADDTEQKDAAPEAAMPESPAELRVPPSVQLPIEALLQLGAPTPPAAGIDPTQLLELATMGGEGNLAPIAEGVDLAGLQSLGAPPDLATADAPPAPEEEVEGPAIDGDKLREVLQEARDTGQQLKQFTPRNFAKDTIGRGIDAALEAGGLRTPTQPPEQP